MTNFVGKKSILLIAAFSMVLTGCFSEGKDDSYYYKKDWEKAKKDLGLYDCKLVGGDSEWPQHLCRVNFHGEVRTFVYDTEGNIETITDDSGVAYGE